MRLLSTDRAELHFFPAPSEVPGGYAILSHSWTGAEQSFQETQTLLARCRKTGENPHDVAIPKIREFCILAERHGYRWLWIDMCCVDVTNPAELSEGVNSIFRWYALAEVCFAYLGDVPGDCDVHAPGSEFRTARWHSHGWTLQEFIAPIILVFVSRDFKVLGTKAGLAPLLEEITGVSSRVLTREVHYSDVSVAERMSWVSKRSITRVEDEAYCLMGLFDVNMPAIYGEGRQAFQRLQREIMKQSFDTSLFAWGSAIEGNTTVTPMPQDDPLYLKTMPHHAYFLADSPKRFAKPFG